MQLERYRLESEIGRGAMATVYRAYDTKAERLVALKLLHRKYVTDDAIRGRFIQEAKTVAQLRHRAIVPILHAARVGEDFFLVMPLMEGGNLTERLERGPLSLVETLSVLERIASALDYAHTQGIVHRDVKPDNILFDESGQAYLADFGIIKLAETNLTMTGTGLIGTPAYMSPEQIQGSKDLDGRTDIYALGVVLFEMLAGHIPFDGDSEMAIAVKHLNAPIPSVRDYVQTLSPAWQKIVNKAMAKKPEERFGTGAEMLAAADSLGSSNSLGDRAAGRVAGVSTVAGDGAVRRWLVAMVLLFIVGAAVILGLTRLRGAAGSPTLPPETPLPTSTESLVIAEATQDIDQVVNATLTAMATLNVVVPATSEPATELPPASPVPPTEPTTDSPTATRTPAATNTAAATAAATQPPNRTPTPRSSQTATVAPTPPPAAAGGNSGTVHDFENFGQWARGNEPNGTLTQSSEQTQSGLSARLTYDFPGVENDYVVFQQERPIPGTPNALRIWVYGDGSAHYLNAWIIDDDGQTWQVPFGQVLHTGWKQMTGYISTELSWPWTHISGPDNDEVDYPIRLRGLVLDDYTPEYRGQGAIFLDSLTYDTVPESQIVGIVPVIPPLPSGQSTPGTGTPAATSAPGTTPTTQAAGPSSDTPGSIVFVAFDELFSTDPAASSPVRLDGFRDYSCQSELTTLLGQTYRLYNGPFCGVGETGTSICKSPDNRFEVVTSNVSDGHSIIVRPAGSEESRFVFQGNLDRPEGIRWSPTSDSFLFVTGDTVYRARTDGTYSEAIPIAYGPQFSPNGSQLLFVKPTGPGVLDLFVSNADGSQARSVTNMAAPAINCPRWRVP